MKRIILVLCSFVLLTFLSGCQNKTNDIEKQKVTINLPYDDSVNGYRTETESNPLDTFTEKEFNKTIEETLKQEAVKVEENTEENDQSTSTHTETVSSGYCGNKNSKVFHNANCGSVKNMKDSNKEYLQSRDEFIQNGYTPCKRCNP